MKATGFTKIVQEKSNECIPLVFPGDVVNHRIFLLGVNAGKVTALFEAVGVGNVPVVGEAVITL